MKGNIKMGGLLAFILVFSLSGCETIPRNITINPQIASQIKEVNAVEALLLDASSNVFLTDQNGKRILSCKEREKTNDKCSRVENGKVNNIRTITIVDWHLNPHCRTYYSSTGVQYERCRGSRSAD